MIQVRLDSQQPHYQALPRTPQLQLCAPLRQFTTASLTVHITPPYMPKAPFWRLHTRPVSTHSLG
jgi:hypothetical protein